MRHARGITSREVGFKHNISLSNGVSQNENEDPNKNETTIVNMDNIHKLSSYELRQELKARGHIFDNDSGTIHYGFLLQQMVKSIQLEKANMEEKRNNKLEFLQSCGIDNDQSIVYSQNRDDNAFIHPNCSLPEKLQKDKARRKAEALERSRQRQLDKTYFARKKQANALSDTNEEEPQVSSIIDKRENPWVEENWRVDACSPVEETSVDHDYKITLDPFQPGFHTKIGGKCA